MTDNRHRNWHTLAQNLSPEWTTERAFSVKSRIIDSYRRQRRNRKRGVVAAVLVPVAVAVGWFVHHRYGESTSATVNVAQEVTGVVAPQSGTAPRSSGARPVLPSTDTTTRAVPMKAGTKFSLEEGESATVYRVTEGSVRFETVRDDARALVVRVGQVTIEDIGTVFVVDALADGRARVAVEEGMVVVTWPSGRRRLTVNETAVFPPPGSAAAEEERPADARVADAEKAISWQQLAREGRYRAAFSVIDGDAGRIRPQADDLLLAADVMRQNGRPKRAVGYLKQILREFPRDGQAPLAAFTLGRVLLDELGRPAEAAHVFNIAASGDGPLAEEANAREVEAWQRAGNIEAARRAATRYLAAYPNGSQRERMKALCGGRTPDEP